MAPETATQTTVTRPEAGTRQVIPVSDGSELTFEFDILEADVTIDGTDVLITLDDGSVVELDGFAAIALGDAPPVLILEDGTELPGDIVVQSLESGEGIAPAAAAAAASGGAGEFRTDTGDVADGIDALGDVSGDGLRPGLADGGDAQANSIPVFTIIEGDPLSSPEVFIDEPLGEALPLSASFTFSVVSPGELITSVAFSDATLANLNALGLTAGGQPVNFAFAGEDIVGTIQGPAPGLTDFAETKTVMTLDLNNDGGDVWSVKFIMNGPIDHDPVQGQNEFTGGLVEITATDSSGDTGTLPLGELTVVDGIPTITGPEESSPTELLDNMAYMELGAKLIIDGEVVEELLPNENPEEFTEGGLDVYPDTVDFATSGQFSYERSTDATEIRFSDATLEKLGEMNLQGISWFTEGLAEPQAKQIVFEMNEEGTEILGYISFKVDEDDLGRDYTDFEEASVRYNVFRMTLVTEDGPDHTGTGHVDFALDTAIFHEGGDANEALTFNDLEIEISDYDGDVATVTLDPVVFVDDRPEQVSEAPETEGSLSDVHFIQHVHDMYDQDGDGFVDPESLYGPRPAGVREGDSPSDAEFSTITSTMVYTVGEDGPKLEVPEDNPYTLDAAPAVFSAETVAAFEAYNTGESQLFTYRPDGELAAVKFAVLDGGTRIVGYYEYTPETINPAEDFHQELRQGPGHEDPLLIKILEIETDIDPYFNFDGPSTASFTATLHSALYHKQQGHSEPGDDPMIEALDIGGELVYADPLVLPEIHLEIRDFDDDVLDLNFGQLEISDESPEIVYVSGAPDLYENITDGDTEDLNDQVHGFIPFNGTVDIHVDSEDPVADAYFTAATLKTLMDMKLSSNEDELQWTMSEDGHSIIGSAGGDDILFLSIDPASITPGNPTVRIDISIDGELNHSEVEGDPANDTLEFSDLQIVVEDADGSTDDATFGFNVEDTEPEIDNIQSDETSETVLNDNMDTLQLNASVIYSAEDEVPPPVFPDIPADSDFLSVTQSSEFSYVRSMDETTIRFSDHTIETLQGLTDFGLRVIVQDTASDLPLQFERSEDGGRIVGFYDYEFEPGQFQRVTVLTMQIDTQDGPGHTGTGHVDIAIDAPLVHLYFGDPTDSFSFDDLEIEIVDYDGDSDFVTLDSLTVIDATPTDGVEASFDGELADTFIPTAWQETDSDGNGFLDPETDPVTVRGTVAYSIGEDGHKADPDYAFTQATVDGYLEYNTSGSLFTYDENGAFQQVKFMAVDGGAKLIGYFDGPDGMQVVMELAISGTGNFEAADYPGAAGNEAYLDVSLFSALYHIAPGDVPPADAVFLEASDYVHPPLDTPFEDGVYLVKFDPMELPEVVGQVHDYDDDTAYLHFGQIPVTDGVPEISAGDPAVVWETFHGLTGEMPEDATHGQVPFTDTIDLTVTSEDPVADVFFKPDAAADLSQLGLQSDGENVTFEWVDEHTIVGRTGDGDDAVDVITIQIVGLDAEPPAPAIQVTTDGTFDHFPADDPVTVNGVEMQVSDGSLLLNGIGVHVLDIDGSESSDTFSIRIMDNEPDLSGPEDPDAVAVDDNLLWGNLGWNDTAGDEYPPPVFTDIESVNPALVTQVSSSSFEYVLSTDATDIRFSQGTLDALRNIPGGVQAISQLTPTEGADEAVWHNAFDIQFDMNEAGDQIIGSIEFETSWGALRTVTVLSLDLVTSTDSAHTGTGHVLVTLDAPIFHPGGEASEPFRFDSLEIEIRDFDGDTDTIILSPVEIADSTPTAQTEPAEYDGTLADQAIPEWEAGDEGEDGYLDPVDGSDVSHVQGSVEFRIGADGHMLDPDYAFTQETVDAFTGFNTSGELLTYNSSGQLVEVHFDVSPDGDVLTGYFEADGVKHLVMEIEISGTDLIEGLEAGATSSVFSGNTAYLDAKLYSALFHMEGDEPVRVTPKMLPQITGKVSDYDGDPVTLDFGRLPVTDGEPLLTVGDPEVPGSDGAVLWENFPGLDSPAHDGVPTEAELSVTVSSIEDPLVALRFGDSVIDDDGNLMGSALSSHGEALTFELSEDGLTVTGTAEGADAPVLIIELVDIAPDFASATVRVTANGPVDHLDADGNPAGSVEFTDLPLEAEDMDGSVVSDTFGLTINDGVPVLTEVTPENIDDIPTELTDTLATTTFLTSAFTVQWHPDGMADVSDEGFFDPDNADAVYPVKFHGDTVEYLNGLPLMTSTEGMQNIVFEQTAPGEIEGWTADGGTLVVRLNLVDAVDQAGQYQVQFTVTEPVMHQLMEDGENVWDDAILLDGIKVSATDYDLDEVPLTLAPIAWNDVAPAVSVDSSPPEILWEASSGSGDPAHAMFPTSVSLDVQVQSIDPVDSIHFTDASAAALDGQLMSGDYPVEFSVSSDGQTLTGTADGETVITLAVTGIENSGLDADILVTMHGPVNHGNAGEPLAFLTVSDVPVFATDVDGDLSAPGLFSFQINDAGPKGWVTYEGAASGIEPELTEEGFTNVLGAGFHVAWHPDGPAADDAVTFDDAVIQILEGANLKTTGGERIDSFEIGPDNFVYGSTADGETYLKLWFDGPDANGDGELKLDLAGPLMHRTGRGEGDEIELDGVKLVVRDYDGDTDVITFDNLVIEDDEPFFNADTIDGSQLIEGYLNDSGPEYSDIVASVGIDQGNDGATVGFADRAFNELSDWAAEHTSHGQSLEVVKTFNTGSRYPDELTVETADQEVFSLRLEISADGETMNVVLETLEPIDHLDASGEPMEGLLTLPDLKLVIRDGDGDRDFATLESVVIEDGVPRAADLKVVSFDADDTAAKSITYTTGAEVIDGLDSAESGVHDYFEDPTTGRTEIWAPWWAENVDAEAVWKNGAPGDGMGAFTTYDGKYWFNNGYSWKVEDADMEEGSTQPGSGNYLTEFHYTGDIPMPQPADGSGTPDNWQGILQDGYSEKYSLDLGETVRGGSISLSKFFGGGNGEGEMAAVDIYYQGTRVTSEDIAAENANGELTYDIQYTGPFDQIVLRPTAKTGGGSDNSDFRLSGLEFTKYAPNQFVDSVALLPFDFGQDGPLGAADDWSGGMFPDAASSIVNVTGSLTAHGLRHVPGYFSDGFETYELTLDWEAAGSDTWNAVAHTPHHGSHILATVTLDADGRLMLELNEDYDPTGGPFSNDSWEWTLVGNENEPIQVTYQIEDFDGDTSTGTVDFQSFTPGADDHSVTFLNDFQPFETGEPIHLSDIVDIDTSGGHSLALDLETPEGAEDAAEAIASIVTVDFDGDNTRFLVNDEDGDVVHEVILRDVDLFQEYDVTAGHDVELLTNMILRDDLAMDDDELAALVQQVSTISGA